MTSEETLIYWTVNSLWYKEGDFVLSSGQKSNYYVDFRPAIMNTQHIHLITEPLIKTIVHNINLAYQDLLCGVISSGLFLAGALLQRFSTLTAYPDVSAIYVRTEHRTHGTKKNIEGAFNPGQSVVIIDDVATSGKSIKRVAEVLREANLNVKGAVVILDREEGARESLSQDGIKLYSAITRSAIIRHKNLLSSETGKYIQR